MSVVRVSDLSAGYGGENVLEDISFEINPGEVVGILGENGCGKSTLAKAVCGLIPHKGGVSLEAGRIGYIPQKSGIGIDISVLDVVLMGYNPRLKLFESPGSAMKKEAECALESVGLSGYGERNYLNLSEGQKRLVILARALVGDEDLLVLDEPESALDFGMRYEVMDIIKRRAKKQQSGVLVILHDTTLALNGCQRIILIKNKKISGIIDPKNDTMELMEENLRRIYGDISLCKVSDKAGIENPVMVWNSSFCGFSVNGNRDSKG